MKSEGNGTTMFVKKLSMAGYLAELAETVGYKYNVNVNVPSRDRVGYM